MFSSNPLVYSICGLPVKLELDRDTDDAGFPVHENCYTKLLLDKRKPRDDRE
jgi:hypothetical protein